MEEAYTESYWATKEWEQEHLEFQARFEWLDEWPQEEVLEF